MCTNMRKVVIKISQGSVVTQTVLGGLANYNGDYRYGSMKQSSSYKFPTVFMC